jgi:tRNA threonylcarbamoyladenosine biosynthesis protein TsaE
VIRVASNSVAETQAVAMAVHPLLRPGDVILLGGELGAGKTVFTQGLARAMGIGEAVTSPTFTLVRSYDGPGGRQLLHADLYRLERLQEVIDLGLPELIEDAAVSVIEWGEVAAPVLPPDHLDIRIGFGPGEGDDERVLDLTPVGTSWVARARALRETVAP